MNDEKAQYQRDRQVWAEKKRAWVAHEQRLQEELAVVRASLALTEAALKNAYEQRDCLADLVAELRAADPHEPAFYLQGQTGVEPMPEPDVE